MRLFLKYCELKIQQWFRVTAKSLCSSATIFRSAAIRWKYGKRDARCSSSVNRTRHVEFVTCARYRWTMSHDIELCDGALGTYSFVALQTKFAGFVIGATHCYLTLF